MLDNKKKSKKKKIKNIDLDDYEDNLQSMRSWVRKIEQSTNSISSRLAAVEKRISKNMDSDDAMITVDISAGHRINNVFANLNDLEDEDLREISKILASEITGIQQDLINQENEISLFNEKIDDLTESFNKIKEEIGKTLDYEQKVFADISKRVHKIENRAPPVMKLGNMEIPIEISGIIAGCIALFAAIMVFFGMQNLLTSPMFLGFVGLLFIGSALAKTFKTKKAEQKQQTMIQPQQNINQQSVPQIYREQ